MKQKTSFVFLLVFIFFSTFFGLFSFLQYQNFEKEISKIILVETLALLPKKPKPIVLIFVGDIMLNRGVEKTIQKNGNNDYKFPFLKVVDYLKGADILFGNLESVISDNGKKMGSIYSFRAKPAVIEGLKYAGFDVVNLANNHAFDYGSEALEDCLKRLKDSEIEYIGAGFSEKEAYSPKIFEIKNTKIAFLAYTNLGSESWATKNDKVGIAWFNEKKMEENVKKAKELADLVIVSFHFGDEYQKNPNQNQKYLAKLAIENGADLIIGHHPHVTQGIEEYKGKLIFYSLGNFIFDQYFSKDTQEGLTVVAEIYPKKINYRLFPIQINLSQPVLMSQNETYEFLEELAKKSDSDFFDQIKNGNIEIKR